MARSSRDSRSRRRTISRTGSRPSGRCGRRRRSRPWCRGFPRTWHEATRRGQVVIVEGEPGEGKTRLIEELVAHARLDDASVATARAVPAEQNAEWSVLSGLLAGGLGDAPGLAGAPPAALAGLAALDGDLR